MGGRGLIEGGRRIEGGRTDCTRRVAPSVGEGLRVHVSSFPCLHQSVASPASPRHHLPCVCVCCVLCVVCCVLCVVRVCVRVWIYVHGLVSKIILGSVRCSREGGGRERWGGGSE